MPWQNRISSAAYTSPSGRRFEFVYEDVARSVDKKTTVFDFPNVAGSLIQDFGRSGRRYPWRVIFTGSDYDIEADQFFEALGERGAGLLEHPRYGVVAVVPVGRIRQRDDLKTEANQAIFEIAFWETLGTALTAPQSDNRNSVFGALEDFVSAISETFAETLFGSPANERAARRGLFTNLLNATNSTLGPIAAATDTIERDFQDAFDSVNTGVDQLISDPLTLAFQVSRLIRFPASAASLVSARLSAYANLAGSIVSGDQATTRAGFAVRELYAENYIAGMAATAANIRFGGRTPDTPAGGAAAAVEFRSRAQVIEVAEQLVSNFEAVEEWRGGQLNDREIVEEGASYQQLQKAVAFAVNYLIDQSFTLRIERRAILDRNRNFIELIGELYGELDSRFDEFITVNSLTGSELITIPEGREVVYYR